MELLTQSEPLVMIKEKISSEISLIASQKKSVSSSLIVVDSNKDWIDIVFLLLSANLRIILKKLFLNFTKLIFANGVVLNNLRD